MVLAAQVRERPGGDAKQFVPLLRQVRHQSLEYVYADRAYISRKNVQYVHDPGAYPAIEPESGLGSTARGHRGYRELVREYQDDPECWRLVHKYGRRSLLDTVFSMMKLRFTGCLSSRGEEEQERELLIKVLLHNIERLNYLHCAGWRFFTQGHFDKKNIRSPDCFAISPDKLCSLRGVPKCDNTKGRNLPLFCVLGLCSQCSFLSLPYRLNRSIQQKPSRTRIEMRDHSPMHLHYVKMDWLFQVRIQCQHCLPQTIKTVAWTHPFLSSLRLRSL
ncbi:MAG: transposase [Candidatus Thorarchaeota archaeon]